MSPTAMVSPAAEIFGARQQVISVAMLMSKADPSSGGTQKQAFRLAAELQARGVSVLFLSKRKHRKERDDARRQLTNGVQVVRLPVAGIQPAWSFLFSFLVWAWIHRSSFQIIHAHNAATGVVAAIAGALLGKNVIVKIPSLKYVRYLTASSFSGRLRRWILTRQTDRFIAVSMEMRHALLEAGIASEQLALLPNGIDLNAGAGADRDGLRQGIAGDCARPIVLFVGRLVPEKGLERLLNAWAALPHRHEMMLVIVGDGPLRESLERRARELGLFSSVQFAGHQTDVKKFYCAADVFVLPSITEGMSNALLEAMASRLPVIASDTGGNKDLIRHEHSGFLVDWEDTERCAGLLTALCRDKDLRRRIGDAAQAEIHRFAMAEVAERYRAVYRAVLRP